MESAADTVAKTQATSAAGRGESALSLVMPAYNEEQGIAEAIQQAVAALDRLQLAYEVIIVDDGSTDDTAQQARNAARARPDEVRVISLPQNLGYGAALQAGFRAARFELVAFTDADCQFDVGDLGRLLSHVESADLVCGYRIGRKDAWSRKVYSHGFNVLVRALLGTGVRDCDCALKVFRRDWVNSIGLESRGFLFNAELLTRARIAGKTIAEVGVAHYSRKRGQSKVSLRHVLPVLIATIRCWWQLVMFPGPAARALDPDRGFFESRAAEFVALALLGGWMLFPQSAYPLLDPDESRYAEIAREMYQSGDPIVPTRLGQVYLDKPPLLYWLTAAGFRLWGVGPFWVHFLPALLAWATLLATYLLGAPLVGRRAAWSGGVLLLMSIGFLLSGRFLFMDTLLTLCTTISLLAGFSASSGAALRPGLWILAALTCGLGILTKGPVAAALCVPPLLASDWLTGRTRSLRAWALFAATAAAVAVPWFVAIELRQPGFLAEYIYMHHFQRMAGALRLHDEPWWFYGMVLWIGMAPCSILFPAAATFFAGRASRNGRAPALGFLLLAAVWITALFSISSCKLPPYVLPVAPLLCLATGTALEGIIARRPQQQFLAYVRRNSPRDLIYILLAGIVVAAVFDMVWLSSGSPARLVSWTLVVLSGSIAAWLLKSGCISRIASRWLAAGGYVLLALGFGLSMLYPVIAEQRSFIAQAAEMWGDEIVRPDVIVCFDLMREETAFAFHFRDRRVTTHEAGHPRDAIHDLQSSSRSLLLTSDRSLPELLAELPANLAFVELGRREHMVVARLVDEVELAGHPAELSRTAEAPAKPAWSSKVH